MCWCVHASLACICTYCGKIYSRKGDLTRHEKTHTHLPEHSCPVQDCKRGGFPNGFHRKDKLVDHMIAAHKLDPETVRTRLQEWTFDDLVLNTKLVLPLAG